MNEISLQALRAAGLNPRIALSYNLDYLNDDYIDYRKRNMAIQIGLHLHDQAKVTFTTRPTATLVGAVVAFTEEEFLQFSLHLETLMRGRIEDELRRFWDARRSEQDSDNSTGY